MSPQLGSSSVSATPSESAAARKSSETSPQLPRNPFVFPRDHPVKVREHSFTVDVLDIQNIWIMHSP